MKTFLAKLFFLAFLILASVTLLIIYNPPRLSVKDDDYMAAIIDKHRRLERLEPPRLIFVGGSNLAFGLDSRRIQDETGIPTVNMSLHAGLGMPFMLNEIEQSLKKGDSVVLSFEYHIDHLLTGQKTLQNFTANLFPPAIQYLNSSFASLRRIEYGLYRLRYFGEKYLEAIQTTALSGTARRPEEFENEAKETPYRRAAFSQEGDVIGHLNNLSLTKLNGTTKLRPQDYGRFIKRINEFVQNAKSRGAVVYFMFPAFPLSQFKANKREIVKYQKLCLVKLDVEIINTPELFAFPDSYFYDTIYHLNKTGRDWRTSLTVELLKNKLNKPSRF